MAIRIQLRKDHPNVWDSADPTLAAGEFGFAWDSADSASFGRLKIGDGSTSWTNLPYFYSAGDSAGNYASAGGAGGFSLGGDRALGIGGMGVLTNVIEYWSISTAGNASDFGDTTEDYSLSPAATSDGSTGIYKSRGNSTHGKIDYISIASLGNATSFGTGITVGDYTCAFSDGTYGLWAGGYNVVSGGSRVNSIEYVTIQTTSNATDFGDMSDYKIQCSAGADTTRGVIGGGGTASVQSGVNNMDYVATATPGNSTDFGDLTVARSSSATVGDGTYAVWCGGYDANWDESTTMDYITIQTTSNATDFGDISTGCTYSHGGSDGTYGSITLGIDLNGSATNAIHNITIATPGNSTDHGDLLTARYGVAVAAGSPS